MKKLELIALICLATNAMAQVPSTNQQPIQKAPQQYQVMAQTETLSNGVKVTHTKMGTGTSPKEFSTVKVMYKGTFLDGRVFDQSQAPIELGLNQVIKCWTTGVQKMKVGGTAKLECPANTAYGAAGAGNTIPPNTPLNFEVTLLEVKQ